MDNWDAGSIGIPVIGNCLIGLTWNPEERDIMYPLHRAEVHIFETELGNRTIVYQIDTGLFYQLKFIHKDVLEQCEGRPAGEIVDNLTNKYHPEEVMTVIEDLLQSNLISESLLEPGPDAPEKEDAMLPDRLEIMLHVCHACNLACPYCLAGKGDFGRPGRMTSEVAQEAARGARAQAKPLGRCQITFFGGEPLLNFDLIQEIVPFARKEARTIDMDLLFGIITNGTSLPPKVSKFLETEDITVKISMDGDKDAHDIYRTFHNGDGSHDIVTRNIQALPQKVKERTQLHTTINAQTIDRQPEIEQYLKSFGTWKTSVANVVANPETDFALKEEDLPYILGHLRAKSNLDLETIMNEPWMPLSFDPEIKNLLVRRKKKRGCGAGRSLFSITIEGDIYFCQSLASYQEFRMGNVFSGLDLKVQREFDQQFEVTNRPECKKCWVRNLCGGGCVYDAKTATGNPIQPNPVTCESIRYSYELAMEMCLEIQEHAPSLLPKRYGLRKELLNID